MSARVRAHPWWRQETAAERDARLHAEQEAMWTAERVERLRKLPADGVREPAFEYGTRVTVGVIDPYPLILPLPLCPEGEHEMEECSPSGSRHLGPIYRCIKCRHYFVEESEGGTK